MVLPEQLFAAVLGDGTELVVGKGDNSALVGSADDGVLVQGKFQILQLLKRT